MINKQGKFPEESTIANNSNQDNTTIQSFKSESRIIVQNVYINNKY